MVPVITDKAMTGKKQKNSKTRGEEVSIASNTTGSPEVSMMESGVSHSLHKRRQKLVTQIRNNECELHAMLVEGNASIPAIQTLIARLGELTGQLLDIVEAMQDENDSEDASSMRSEPLWSSYEALEREISDSVSLANKYIRQKIYENSSHSSSRSSSETVDKHQTEYTIPGLKKPELSVFSGDQMQYSDWSEMFNAFVDSENIPAKLKMIYLKNYLAGEPLRIVERYRPTETGYTKAKGELEKKYGGTIRKIRNELDAIRRTRPIQVDETKRLEEFSDRVTSLVTNLKESGCVSDLTNTSAYYILVVEKLHHFYVKNFNRWLSTEHREDNFETFAEWLADEALYEKRAKEMTQTTNSTSQSRHQSKKTFRIETEKQQPAVYQSFKMLSGTNCMVCQANHTLESCAVFQSWTVGRRYEFCKQTRLCFRCLAGQHRGLRCRRFPGCQLDGCGGSHHTLLHASQRQERQPEQSLGRLKEQNGQMEYKGPQHNNRQTTSQLTRQGQLEHNGQLSWLQYHQEGIQASGSQPPSATSTNVNSNENPQNSRISYNTATPRSPSGKGAVAFQTVPVRVHHHGRVVTLNALLDPCSDASFISKAAAAEIGFDGTSQNFELGTVNGVQEVTMKAGYVKISSLHSSFEADLTVFVIPSLDGASVGINWNDAKKKWTHLRNIQFPKMSRSRGIDLLLGISASTVPLFVPLDTVSGSIGEPVAVLTPLGWTAFGCIESTLEDSSKDVSCMKNMSNFAKTFRTNVRRKVNEDELHIMQSMTDLELMQVKSSKESLLSREEQTAVDKVKKSLKYTGSRYQAAVPWRDEEPSFENNYDMAMSRLVKTERSLLKRQDEDLPKKYNDVFEQYVNKGYLTEVTNTKHEQDQGKVWYLPHFPVVKNDRSTTKIRVVYDAAARHQDISLNSQLLPGPSLYSDLTETLIGFRQHPVALIGDVSEMFLQVELAPEDRRYHRILWRNMRTDEDPTIYEANRWIFGNAAAPFVAQYVIKEHALRRMDEYPLGAETLTDMFYMDDCIASYESGEAAAEARRQVAVVLHEAGMKIRKWRSNCDQVMDTIPVEDRGTDAKHVIEDRSSTSTKTLGLVWSTKEDRLSVDSSRRCSTENLTKRSCLKEMAAVFDPLCLFSPFVVRSKMLFQDTWAAGVDWDDPLTEELEYKWREWLSELTDLSRLSVPRCLHPYEGKPKQEIHVFCDASEQAYAAAIYVVSEYAGERSSHLALARARVTPRAKRHTIPRLELMGALLGVRLVKKVCEVLKIPVDDVFFWSDSMDVLCWLRNEVRRFQTFVAHRISEIREVTRPGQWQHVPGVENPADLPTRGLTLDQLRNSELWWHGPGYLLEAEDQWPQKKEFSKEKHDQTEFRKQAPQKTVLVTTVPDRSDDFRLRPERFSTWRRLVRVTAWVWRFIDALRRGLKSPSEDGEVRATSGEELGPEELLRAEEFWIRRAQKEAFGAEIEELRRNGKATTSSPSKKSYRQSPVKQLTPFLDGNGVLRVGGRLQRSELAFESKHPVLLPKRHHISKLIIRQYHEDADHAMGTEHTLSEVRRHIWIPGARQIIKSVVRDCVVCQKNRKKPEAQLMAPKIDSQVCPSFRAFDKCAVDYAGPFETRQGRGKARQKRYLCLFSCLQTRAVHLEMAYGLDTDSFIRDLMRFVSRRGKPSEITSDNGKNFVGATKELKCLVGSIDSGKVQKELSKYYIRWQFTPPGAPHFNGACEAMIKCAKRALKMTLKRADLTDEELQTAFCRAEALLNTRPITVVSSDVNDEKPLTPADFILGTASIETSTTQQDDDGALRQRWKRLQQLSTEFWKRWLREYVPALQAKSKWLTPQADLKSGDLVLVVDSTTPRGQWPMGRVEEVLRGSDGHVRVATVKLQGRVVTRPVVKLVRIDVLQ